MKNDFFFYKLGLFYYFFHSTGQKLAIIFRINYFPIQKKHDNIAIRTRTLFEAEQSGSHHPLDSYFDSGSW